jgi:diguanylate cyclase (GGDEF)-like protein
VLAHVRPLILVIDQHGTISAAYGAAEGLAGHSTTDLVGRHATDFVADEYIADVAEIFLRENPIPVMNTPASFPLDIVGPAGRETVDVIPRGIIDDRDAGWVVTLIPRSSSSAPLGVIDLMLDDAPIDVIVGALLAHLDSSVDDNAIAAYALLRTRHEHLSVLGLSRDALSEALQALIDSGNDRVWRAVPGGSTVEYLTEQLPRALRTVAEQEGMEACQVSTIVLDGELECALVVFVSDRLANGLRGNTAISRREHVRIIMHALRRDIADRKLQTAAHHDALTGLSNRGKFDDVLNDLGSKEATLLFIDLDRFKDVNDRFGHDVGDRVLVEIARRLRVACRPRDVVARIGGDEFAVLLTDIDEATALGIAERLLAAIGAPFAADLGPVSISASIGLARRTGPTDPYELMQAADRAMLHGKRTGRARLVVAD